MQQHQKKIMGELSAKNKEQEVTFFEKIKLEKGVKSLIDGIKYRDYQIRIRRNSF